MFRTLALAALLIAAKLAAYAAVVGGDPAPALCRYDCSWYDSIAAQGYAATVNVARGLSQHAWPFFPLLPIVLALTRRLSGLDLPHAGCLIASACTVLLAAVGVRYRELTRTVQRRSTWLLLVVAMPFGFYFATSYAEAPYALLSIITLLYLDRERLLAASVSASLLGAARPTGILLAPAIIIAGLRRAAGGSVAHRAVALAPAFLAVTGLLAWMAYCALETGDPLRFAHAQVDWGRHFANPLHVLQSAFRGALKRHHGRGQGYQALWATTGLIAGLLLSFRRRWAEGSFLAATVLLALSSGTLGSMPRFVGANPVFLLFVADGLDRLGPRLRYGALAASAVLQLVLFRLWMQSWQGLI